jgi:hypothetical protein
VKQTALLLSLALLAAPCVLFAQPSSSSFRLTSGGSGTDGGAANAASHDKAASAPVGPFSRVALSGGFSLMGVNMQVATNLNRYLNLRGTGNYFNYTDNNISTNGFNITGKVNMATAGASLDYYPFPNHGFRLSPGLLFYNQNQISANSHVVGGTSFTLNDQQYYSATANTATGATPINLTGSLGLNTYKQAFTMTTGWGNMIPRRGGHWSFPFELGAAVTGTPSINVILTGWACTDAAQTFCNSVSGSNPIATQVQGNLNAQVDKWKSDLDPLKVYPILSFGVAYAFRVR